MQIRLRFQVFQSFMIRMYDKFFWPQIMLPNLKNSNKCIQFFIKNRVVQSSTSKLLTEKSNRSTFLHQHTTNAYTTSIHSTSNCLAKSGNACNGAEVSKRFSSSNARSWATPQTKGTPFLVKSFKGAAIVLKYFTKRL